MANALCALGQGAQLARGQELAPDPETDRLVWLASGAAKLVARGPAAPNGGTPAAIPG
ncbi:MAG: hypothetical protein ACKO1O_13645 [Erythrobacter sp.]